MKIFLTLLAVGACLAYPVEDDKYGMHHNQHRTSVDAAKQGMQERLSKLEQNVYQRQYGANENYVAGCTSGCSTGLSSQYRSSSSSNLQRSSANALDNSDYVGVGILSHNNYGNDESDVQQRISGRYSSGSGLEADDLQQRVVPGDLSNIQSSAYRQTSRSNYREEEEEEDVQKSVGAGFHDLSVNTDGYEAQSQRRKQQQQKESETRITSGGRPVYYVPGGSSSTYRSTGSNTESQYTESRTQRPIAVGQYVNLAVRPGSTAVLTIPVSAQDQQRTYGSSSRREYQAGSEASRTRVQPGYQLNYYPTYSVSDRTTGSRTESDSSRSTSYQQPEKLTSTEYSSSRYNRNEVSEEEEDTQQRISPVAPITTRLGSTSGGSTNYQQGYTSSRVVPLVPVHTVESTSSSSQRTAEEQRRYNEARLIHNQRTTANRNENEQASGSQYTSSYRPVYSTNRASDTVGSQYGSSGTSYYTSPINSRTQIQSQNQQGSAQSQYQAGSGTRYVSYPSYTRTGGSDSQLSSSDSTQSRFNSHTATLGSDDLNTYMTESERLARIQQNQIANSQSRTSALSASEANRRTVNTASSLDSSAANFVSSSNLANRLSELDNVENIAGTGGYKRVKSWQKQSKWASGSQYGTDGEPKSYSMLSTAEAEKHNINGAETGYKAATTTLENDGKVSTYSIHTP